MIDQFDLLSKRLGQRQGTNAVWTRIPFDDKTIQPQYLMAEETLWIWQRIRHGLKVAFMESLGN